MMFRLMVLILNEDRSRESMPNRKSVNTWIILRSIQTEGLTFDSSQFAGFIFTKNKLEERKTYG